MRVSISAKILFAFFIVLAAFGGVVLYGGVRLRRLGDELSLVSRGYLELRLVLSELQTTQSNLLKVVQEQANRPDGFLRTPAVMKFTVDDARRVRLMAQMPQALSDLHRLEGGEGRALLELRTRFEKVEADFRADEPLFDRVFGVVGDAAPAWPAERASEMAIAGEKLLRSEQAIRRNLAHLSAELRLQATQSALRLEQDENRAVWALVALSAIAAAVCVAMMIVATRLLRPLRRLAEGAKRIARGEYKERVDERAHDEIGQLAREFNAMAQALDEREQALIRSERLAAVGKIAAQITHEVRNPLSSIGLNAEMLEEELGQAGPGSEAQKLASAIVKEVDRLTEITEEYLRFARLPRPKLEREDLATIVSSLLAFLRPELEARRIAVEVELAPGLAVAADEHQLRQALLNLLRNAVEAMAPGGRLRLVGRGGKPSGVVELTIADTGRGIAREHLAKVFDPFFSTKDGGTGLGLALTQEIVVEHGGTIGVESELGRGTTFTVRLPALEVAGEPEPAPLAVERARG